MSYKLAGLEDIYNAVTDSYTKQVRHVYDRASGATGAEDFIRASDYMQALSTGSYKTTTGNAYISSGTDPMLYTGAITATSTAATISVNSSGLMKAYGPTSLRERLLAEHDAFAGGVLRA